MPQVDLHYTSDPLEPGALFDESGRQLQQVEFADVFQAIENAILGIDPDAGQSKCRAHAISEGHYLHEHVYIEAKFLKKEHRNEAWQRSVAASIEKSVKVFFKPGTKCQLDLQFLSPQYRAFVVPEVESACGP